MTFRQLAIALAFLSSWVCAAAADRPQRPAEIEALLDSARAAPAEIAADALLHVAESDKVADPAWKRELLEEAFRRAAGAQQPWKRVAVAATRDYRSNFLNRAFAQNLDTCSLRCRAVRGLLALDKKKARELFSEMIPPDLPPATCEDALVFDVSQFYEALTAVAESAFTRKEVAEGEQFQFLARYITAVHSPVQVGPIAQALAAAKINGQQLQALILTFGAALNDIADDDRSFAFSASSGGLNTRMVELVNVAKRNEMNTYPLVESYRNYLVKRLKAARCAGSDLSDPARSFNANLRGESVRAITGEEMRPATVQPAPAPQRACASVECASLVTGFNSLLLGPSGVPFTFEQRNESTWQSRLKEYLAAMADWKEDPDGSRGDYFRQKCRFFSELVNLVPNGPNRELVLRSLVEFLKLNDYQQENRIEWYLAVSSVIGRASLEPLVLGDILQELRNSPDPLIALCAHLEQLVPRPPERILALL